MAVEALGAKVAAVFWTTFLRSLSNADVVPLEILPSSSSVSRYLSNSLTSSLDSCSVLMSSSFELARILGILVGNRILIAGFLGCENNDDDDGYLEI